MNSLAWAELASGFQLSQLQGGAVSEQRCRERVVRGLVPWALSLPCLGLVKAGVLYLGPWPLSGHKVPLNALPLTLQH